VRSCGDTAEAVGIALATGIRLLGATDVNRRRIELQLRLLQALFLAESRRRSAGQLVSFKIRAEPILDSTEVAIGEDAELRQLLDQVRREISAGSG
jgi:hypothetical protein